MAEFSQCNALKEGVRAKLTWNSSQPDIEKIKKDVRSEMEAEFRKNGHSGRQFELTYQKFHSGFHFSDKKSHVTLRDVSGEVLGGCFFCLAPARSFPPLTRWLSLPSYTPGLS